MSSETLVLSSEVSRGTYPDNNGGCFTTDLGQPLIFGSDDYVKITDLAYTHGSWNNVRENSNEITLKMRGCPVWGLVPATLYHSGEMTFETGTRKKYRRNSNRQFTNVDVYRMHISLITKTTRENIMKIPLTSDWIPGKPTDINGPKPIFRTIKAEHLNWTDSNKVPLNILMPGKVAATSNEWQIAKGYLPCNYYALFQDFQLAFVNCVNEK